MPRATPDITLTAPHDTPPDTAQRGSNQSGMRADNERLVLTLIRQNGALAKAEIARQTGLSAQTVSVIMRALEADGLLRRGTPIRGKIGQPSVPMHLAADGAFFFGLKIGRRSLDLVLTDFLGTIRHRVRQSHPYPTPEATARFVRDAARACLHTLDPALHSRVAGLGIALPFQLWEWADTLGTGEAEMRAWKDCDIAAEIGPEINAEIGREIGADNPVPVFVCNDASAACGAELVFGTQPSAPRDFLYVFVGFFIGGGLVLGGTLYTGRTGNAAALGSMRVQAPDGTPRQLVDTASLATLETTLARNGQSAAMIWQDPDRWTIPAPVLDAWLDTAAHGIAQAISASACLMDIDHVLLDGWMPAPMRTDLVARVHAELTARPCAGVQTPQIAEGTIGPDARALGAASLPLSNRFLMKRQSYQKGPST